MKELVSVIVPVYNVEQFVEQCIKSIQKQTHFNIEIIIVNDGSTDASYEKCQNLSKNDKRIKLFSKENGGLASARNYGLKHALGEYIVFVDSDDFIEDNMVERMLKTTIESKSDITCCNYMFFSEAGCKTHKIKIKKNQTWESDRAIQTMLYDNYYRCYAWNKMYKRSVFDKISFPEGKLYEDIVTTYNLYKISNKIAVLNNALYFYRVRENSITHNTKDKRIYDILEPIRYILDDTKNHNVKNGCIRYYLFFFNDSIIAGIWNEDVYLEFKKLLKDNALSFLVDKNISCITKIRVMILAFSFTLYKKLYLLYKCPRNVKN